MELISPLIPKHNFYPRNSSSVFFCDGLWGIWSEEWAAFSQLVMQEEKNIDAFRNSLDSALSFEDWQALFCYTDVWISYTELCPRRDPSALHQEPLQHSDP